MHPDVKQVIPLGAEPIKNTDGSKKQDGEINAAKRFVPKLRHQFPKMNLIITGDDLFSHQLMIETVLKHHYHYFFVAKESSHTFMTEWLQAKGPLNEIKAINKKGQIVLHQWMNDVPLVAGEEAIRVNFFRKKTITVDALGIEKHERIESWVTSFEVTAERVRLFVRGAKTRWKVENECFNTLKNQGYHLTHNYGHGEKHLAFNFYQLTVLAFTLHQVAELCDIVYQACRKMAGSKRSLWEKLRTFVNSFIFESLEQLLKFYLNIEAYDIIDGYVLERQSP